jgi:hypothetical protein
MQVAGFSANGAGSNAVHMLWGVFEFPIYTMSQYDFSGAQQTSAVDIFFTVIGWGPMQTIYIPMSQLLDGEADAIDTKQFGRIDFKVTTASYSASAITHIVAEYLKPNGA